MHKNKNTYGNTSLSGSWPRRCQHASKLHTFRFSQATKHIRNTRLFASKPVVVEYEWQVWKWDEWLCANPTQSQHSKFPPQCHINYASSQFEQTNIFAQFIRTRTHSCARITVPALKKLLQRRLSGTEGTRWQAHNLWVWPSIRR